MNRAVKKFAQTALLLQKPMPMTKSVTNIVTRNSHAWIYRRSAEGMIPKKNYVIAECIGGFMWFWIFYHIYHEHEHITGEFPYPDPTKWTDAELGIPAE